MKMQVYMMLKNDKEKGEAQGRACNFLQILMLTLAIVLLLVLATMVSLTKQQVPAALPVNSGHTPSDSTIYECQIDIVESIPIGLNYTPNSPTFASTFAVWKQLLDNATKTLDIGSFYWTLRGKEDTNCNDSSTKPGEQIFERLISNAQRLNKISVRIAQSAPTQASPNLDTKILANYNAAEIVSVDFPKFFGGGVLHTKLWIVDGIHFYLGSANMDWRSLTQVKELGVLVQNCPQLTADVAKIFKAYWFLGSTIDAKVPENWPYEYKTDYNMETPMTINVKENKGEMLAYLSSAPPPLLGGTKRSHDLNAILNTINTAVEFVHISVMDYFPLMIYGPSLKFWPYIDDALRRAAVDRGVAVKMLISWWKHSNPIEDNFLRSLKDLSVPGKHVDIQIRRFIVPTDENQQKIPYGRVNHNKYMVTDLIAYIGTSNWSGDYFTNTAGIGLVLKDTLSSANSPRSLRRDLQNIFQRDWDSIYAHELK